jgi:Holliday junction resolvase RusA-like endonuclease
MEIYTIDLPFPMSTNRIWRFVGNPAMQDHQRKYVRISPEYHKWKKAADALYMTQKRRLSIVKLGKFSVSIVLSSDMRRSNQDGDNFIKCVMDWLQRVEIIHNDCLCEWGQWQWGEAPTGCRVRLFGDPHLDSRMSRSFSNLDSVGTLD